MGGEMVFAFTSYNIRDIELEFRDTLNGLRVTPHMTRRCRQYAIKALCYHIFNSCDSKRKESKPKLCRNDCFALYDDVCLAELHLAKKDPRVSRLLPNCSRLPTRNQADHKFCKSLEIHSMSTFDNIDMLSLKIRIIFYFRLN